MALRRLTALLLFACLGHAQAADSPKLIVVIVIDGLPQEQVLKYRDQYVSGGLNLLLRKGAWFGNAHQAHAVTLTAPGHTAVLTGAYPYQSGIIANEWTDPGTLADTYCTGDTAHAYIGEETKKLDGTSPANLRVSTLGDELRYANGGQSKVLAVSGKDRGAILLAGRTGTAYMYMDKSGRFASSTYYMKEHPRWWESFYSKRPQDRWLGKSWSPALAQSAYERSIPDGQPWFPNYRGMGNRLPFVLPGADGKSTAYYGALMGTPYGDLATLDFARAAIEGENLGRNAVPDLLGISLSTHDYVNHSFGPESRESQDHLLHLDRALASFFDYLGARFGANRVLIALTADHGFLNVPEYSSSKGFPGMRVDSKKLLADLNEKLSARFGADTYALRYSYPTIILDRKLLEEKGLSAAEVEFAAARIVTEYPGIAAVYTRTQLENGMLTGGRLATLVQRAWHRQLSGDLYVVQRPYAMFGSNAATHGSPYAYDTNVPLMLYGAPWIKAGSYGSYTEVVDLAPTLAFLLGTRPPSGSEGRVLTEALAGPTHSGGTKPAK
ncbi:MAG TPA: alkaline phosphatase family protein [Burkholderiales bacterium]|nr:alkaline phosphatase family protein [Burkholderiales bacterium]